MFKKLFTTVFATAIVLPAFSQNWLTAGNSGTGSSDFIGTTDNQNLFFRTNNTQRFAIFNDGRMVSGPGSAISGAMFTFRATTASGPKVIVDATDHTHNPEIVISTNNPSHSYPALTFQSASWGTSSITQYFGMWHTVPTNSMFSWSIATGNLSMRLSKNGNLLIGTSTENSARLKLTGSGGMLAEFTDAGTTAGYIRIRNSNSDYTDMGLDGGGIVSLKSNGTAFLYGSAAGSVNIGSSTVDGSAKLSVTSTTQGFLAPRMSTTQKNAIVSPAAGLMVYDITVGKYNYYNGSSWQEFGSGSSQWATSGTNISYATGNVGIGTAAVTEHKLAVAGSIIAEKVKVKLQTNWPDYVFEPGYDLPSIAAVDAFIQKNKHLPGVPSAAEVQSKGLDLGDNQAVLLKKIEELTLYMIELKKENERQNKEIEELRQKLSLTLNTRGVIQK